VCNVGIDERHGFESDKRTSTILTNNSSKNRKTIVRRASEQASLVGSIKPKEEVFVRVSEDPESPEDEDKNEDKMRNKYLLDERLRIQSETEKANREAFVNLR